MSGIGRSFDLDGVVLEVRVESPHLARVLARMLSGYSSPALATHEYRRVHIEIVTGLPAPRLPAGKPRFSFPPMLAHHDGDSWLLIDDVGFLEVRSGEGTIRGSIAAGADVRACGLFATLTLWVAILECLRAAGRYMVHGAALVSPDNQMTLFTGRGGSGKTTAALTLLDAGWRALTDDVLFLDAPGGVPVRTFAHRRPFHLGADLLRRRPHLRPFVTAPEPYEAQDKQWLDADRAFPGQLLSQWGPPDHIVFPNVIDRPASRLREMTPRAALLALFEQSCFVFVDPGLAAEHLAALTAVVNRAPASILDAGPDIFMRPGAYQALLEKDRCRSAASA